MFTRQNLHLINAFVHREILRSSKCIRQSWFLRIIMTSRRIRNEWTVCIKIISRVSNSVWFGYIYIYIHTTRIGNYIIKNTNVYRYVCVYDLWPFCVWFTIRTVSRVFSSRARANVPSYTYNIYTFERLVDMPCTASRTVCLPVHTTVILYIQKQKKHNIDAHA